jgi:hypothetical protein
MCAIAKRDFLFYFFCNLHMQKCINIKHVHKDFASYIHSHYIMYIAAFNTVFLFITVVFVILTIYLDMRTKNSNTDIPKLTNQKPGKDKRSLKKSNVKRIYFVNNSPDTVGARSLTIPRYGIPEKTTKV